MTAGFAPPTPVISPIEGARRTRALEALALMAAQVSPERFDSALLAFAHGPAAGDVAVPDDSSGVPALPGESSRVARAFAGLNPHQLLLRDAAAAAGYATDALPAESLGVPDGGAAGDTVLRLAIGGAVVHYYAQLLWWARAASGIGDPVNGKAAWVLYSKYDTKAALAAAGVPVPTGRRFRREELSAALRYAAGCAGSLCVKHDMSANGWLVLPGLCTVEEVAGACSTVARFAEAFVVEEHVAGEAWRFFWVAPEIVGIKVGRPASVVGDGERTVRALLRERNARRRERTEVGPTPPVLEGAEVARVLAWQGLTLDGVPAPGAMVWLSWHSNGMRGADSLALRERLHPGYVAAMTRAFQAIPGVQVAAADVMIADPSVPPEAGRYAVVEINTAPSLLAYHHPAEGPVQDVSGAIVRLLERLAGEGVCPDGSGRVG